MDVCRWIDLSLHWEELQQLSWDRHNQKRAFRSSNLWTKRDNTHFYGLCGEFVVAHLTGISIDTKLRIEGDPGYDFAVGPMTYDVKTATFWKSPDLKEFPNKQVWADFYLLSALDMERQRARCVGWATMAQLSNASLRDYGHGQMRSIPISRLRQLRQLGLPLCLFDRTSCASGEAVATTHPPVVGLSSCSLATCAGGRM